MTDQVNSWFRRVEWFIIGAFMLGTVLVLLGYDLRPVVDIGFYLAMGFLAVIFLLWAVVELSWSGRG